MVDPRPEVRASALHTLFQVSTVGLTVASRARRIVTTLQAIVTRGDAFPTALWSYVLADILAQLLPNIQRASADTESAGAVVLCLCVSVSECANERSCVQAPLMKWAF